MRIFYISDKTPNPAFQSNLWRANLLCSLEKMGFDIEEFEGDLSETFRNLDTRNSEHLKFIARNRPVLGKEILNQVRAAHEREPIDLFFSYLYDACLSPNIVEEIKALGIKTANFYCNASYQLHLVENISPHYDWCLMVERFRIDDYKAIGANPLYFQMAANPDVYHRLDTAYKYDVTFVGQRYGDRPHHIQALVDNGLDVRVWGMNWLSAPPVPEPFARRVVRRAGKLFTADGVDAIKRRLGLAVPSATADDIVSHLSALVGGPIADEEMIKLYSESKINIGFAGCGETFKGSEKIYQVKLRDFEIPMSGGFYLVEHCDELGEFYDLEKEVVTFRSPQELADKASYYLAHEGEREAIRNAGYERCRRDHTWENRFRTAFAEMGLINA
ncbi:MAG TPA: glycosyltransferase [Capsulimonadaceae bacterium]|jgi:spore maturation protein CgeB